jgi:hypothetical protein
MKDRAQELKAEARRGPRADQADGESEVLARIAEMSAPDRAMAKRLHAIIRTSAPALSPKTWYGMPAYAKDGKVVCFWPPMKSPRWSRGVGAMAVGAGAAASARAAAGEGGGRGSGRP